MAPIKSRCKRLVVSRMYIFETVEIMKITKKSGFARVSSHVDDFNTRNKVLTAKLLRQGYKYHKPCKAFSKFYRRHFDFVSNVRLKTLFSARSFWP